MTVDEASRRDFLRWLARSGAGLVAVGAAPALLAPRAAAAGNDVVVLLGGTVIDATGAPPRRDTAVVLAGDRITWLGPAAHLPAPAGAQVVDCRGKYVLPGLHDMHTHGADLEQLFPALHLANGVTAVREMWGYPENRATRDKIERGELLGPRITLASSIVDGPVSLLEPPVTKVATDAEARAAVRTARAEGAAFVKVYSYLPREPFLAIADECRKLGLPFAGHWSFRMTMAESSDLGQRSFEHFFGVPIDTSTRRDELLGVLAATPFDPAAPRNFFNTYRELDRQAALAPSQARTAAFFGKLSANGSRLCPTMVLNRAMTLPADTYTHDPRLKYVPRDIREFWADRIKLYSPVTPAEIAQQKAYLEARFALIAAADQAGVGFLGGTDCLNPYSFPGFGLHDELDILVEAGLSPMRALQTVTRDAACFLGQGATSGTVSVGKVADLVVLDANPLEDIGAVRRIDTVVTRGRVLGRAKLTQMLADVEAAANASTARSLTWSGRLPVQGCC